MKKQIFLLILISCFFCAKSQDSIAYPVFYAYNSDVMDSAEQFRLRGLMKSFDSFAISRFVIKAYCDDRGTKKKNDALSNRRADDILKQITPLVPKLDSAAVFNLFGFGKLPLDGKQNIDEQRQKNRRGEIVIYYERRKVETPPIGQKKTAKPAIPAAPKLDAFFATAKPGDKLALKILFEGGSSVLLPESFIELDTLASMLRQNDTLKLKIVGHIYNYGRAEDIDAYDMVVRNNNLSKNRAYRVYKYLLDKGIAKSRLEPEGKGGQEPTGISADLDRRVEIVVKE